jgi:NitT/TauT family transport system permease protein
MSNWQRILAIVAGVAATLGALLVAGAAATHPWLFVFGVAGALSLLRFAVNVRPRVDGLLAGFGGLTLLASLGEVGPSLWLALLATWLFAWLFIDRLAQQLAKGETGTAGLGLVVPLAFGLTLLLLWEVAVRGLGVPQVLLPAPSQVYARIISSGPTLWADFQQTFLKAVLAGYLLGCASGFAVAILVDRSQFLRRGLLPIGNFVSALPIIGIAPIMVMWFGFDWPSKAAVIVCITFFPMLVNTVAGLNASGRMERDLMRTYASGYGQTLFKLRLPAAWPFIFNALKINSTLALIGAIVAEFFGTPIVGMGFRISTEAGRLNVDMVWAEVAVAAVAGSATYGLIVLVERAVTFWHPSVRGGRA